MSDGALSRSGFSVGSGLSFGHKFKGANVIRLVASILAASALVAGPVLAADLSATVTGAQASVLVNRDGVFKPLIGGSASLRQGDRVVAKGGVAKIAFVDGCKIDLKAGAMFTVGKASPCAAAHGGFSKAQAQAGAGGAIAADTVTLPVLGAVSTATAVGVGVGVAVVIGVSAAAASGSFDSSSTSP